MDLILFLFKGIIIGLVFGIPVGAVGTMTISRTLEHGVKAGLITGLGSSVADCIYASVGAFGLTFISDFLISHQTAINFCGGILIIAMGVGTILKRSSVKEDAKNSYAGVFLSSFMIGITNPAAILTFLFAFSYFDLSRDMTLLGGILLVIGVFVGTFIWWLILTGISDRFREKAVKHRVVLCRIFGGLLCAFGVVILIQIYI